MNGEAYPEQMSHGASKPNRVYTDPPIDSRVNTLASQVEPPVTMLDDHLMQLDAVENKLDRAILQYSNMLDRLRGAQPVAGGADKPLQPESIQQRLGNTSDRLNMLSNTLNEMADELNQLI